MTFSDTVLSENLQWAVQQSACREMRNRMFRFSDTTAGLYFALPLPSDCFSTGECHFQKKPEGKSHGQQRNNANCFCYCPPLLGLGGFEMPAVQWLCPLPGTLHRCSLSPSPPKKNNRNRASDLNLVPTIDNIPRSYHRRQEHITFPNLKRTCQLTQWFAFCENAIGGTELHFSFHILGQLFTDVDLELECGFTESTVHQYFVRGTKPIVCWIERD